MTGMWMRRFDWTMEKERESTPRLRILMGAAVALGPGKADLLDAVEQAGSISAAARNMGMSYRRAWILIEALNRDDVEIGMPGTVYEF